ncbi:hypothetical protein SBRY_10786 [Actinacidiphila bryophytorum]|uniref:Uncharacterized protein n=1 Tax=Actinacidiphila bryophytorum TaxID=1436133 RepID=A0A9W4GX60_9ACTN|nr:hypothetical protein SBRY_10786 [Actinacidiphila bryophytorum]
MCRGSPPGTAQHSWRFPVFLHGCTVTGPQVDRDTLTLTASAADPPSRCASRQSWNGAALLVQTDADRLVLGDGGVHLAGQCREHRPGEGVALRCPAVGGGRRNGHPQRIPDQPEDTAQHAAWHRLLQQDRARLVDGDPQILDFVEGEVQSGRETGRGRPQDRQIRPRRGQPDLDEVLRPGLACALGHPHLQGGTQ